MAKSELIADVQFKNKSLQITRLTHSTYIDYNIYHGGVLRHRNCDSEEVIRALMNYLNGVA